jgi:hypothetical protein
VPLLNMRHDLHLWRYRALYWLEVAWGMLVGLFAIPFALYPIAEEKRYQTSLQEGNSPRREISGEVERKGISSCKALWDDLKTLPGFFHFVGCLCLGVILSVYVGSLLSALVTILGGQYIRK